MAAGLSMDKENVETFRRDLNAFCSLTEEDFVEKIHIDVPMPLYYIRTQLIREFERLEPFGKGNEKPVFAVRDVHPLRGNIVGKNNPYRRLLVTWRDYIDAMIFQRRTSYNKKITLFVAGNSQVEKGAWLLI